MFIISYFVEIFSGDLQSIIGQIIGIVAMIMAFISFQCKTQKTIMYFQICAGLLFSIHFGLIGALSGMVLNGIAVPRAIIFSQRSKYKWAKSNFWVVFFIVICCATYILPFTIYGTEPSLKNLLLEILPVIGMIATTVSFSMKKASSVRVFSLISSPAWLVYNLFHQSLGGVITECIVMISIFIGMIRLDRNKN